MTCVVFGVLGGMLYMQKHMRSSVEWYEHSTPAVRAWIEVVVGCYQWLPKCFIRLVISLNIVKILSL